MEDKWAAHRRAEKNEVKRHDKNRAAAFDAKNKAPYAAIKGPITAGGGAGVNNQSSAHRSLIYWAGLLIEMRERLLVWLYPLHNLL